MRKKMRKCSYGCGKNVAKHKEANFTTNNGLRFKIKLGGKECRRCSIRAFLTGFLSDEKSLIKKGMRINWNFYNRSSHKTVLNEFLVALGIFTYKSKGNWEVVDNGSGVILNPMDTNKGSLYFKRVEDAIKFGKDFIGACNVAEIRKISTCHYIRGGK